MIETWNQPEAFWSSVWHVPGFDLPMLDKTIGAGGWAAGSSDSQQVSPRPRCLSKSTLSRVAFVGFGSAAGELGGVSCMRRMEAPSDGTQRQPGFGIRSSCATG